MIAPPIKFISLAATMLAVAAPVTAVAEEPAAPWRLFSVGQKHSTPFIEGLVALADGSILVARFGETRIYRRGPSGRESIFAGSGNEGGALGDGGPAEHANLGGTEGLAVAADGAVLIAAGALIRRVGPDGTITTVAGTVDGNRGESGFGGDGGPAVGALLCGPEDVEALPDGGFLVADTGNRVVRRVAADGTITTVAGVPKACASDGDASAGDGGQATAAVLPRPSDVARLADGGFLIVDASSRLRRVAPDGVITSVPSVDNPESVAGLPDGGFVVSAEAGIQLGSAQGLVTTIGGGGPPASALFGSSTYVSSAGLFNGEGLDAREIALHGEVVRDPLGGFLVAQVQQMWMLAQPPSQRMGIAIRRVKTPAKHPHFTYAATAPGYLEVSVRQGRRRFGPIWKGAARAGFANVPLPRVPPDGYTVTVRTVGPYNTRDIDQLGVVLGGRLPAWVAATAIAANECDCHEDAPDTTEEIGRCRRFALRRVDCRIDARELETCAWVGSAVLRGSGFVWTRHYGCPMRAQRPGRSPKWSAAPLL